MKRLSVLIIVLLLLITACSRETVQIGYVSNLTGKSSELGVSGRDGALLAIQEWNEKGGLNGQKIQLVVKNDEGDAATATAVDQELLDQGIQLIIGHLLSATHSTIDSFAGEKVLFVSPLMSTTALSGKDDHFLRIIGASTEQGIGIANVIKEKDFKRIAIITDAYNEDYTSGVRSALLETLKKDTLDIVYDMHEVLDDDINYDQIAFEISENEPDATVFITSGTQAAYFIQNINKYDQDMGFLGVTWTTTSDLLVQGGQATEGFIGISVYDPNDQSQKYQEFRQGYLDAYGKEPSFSAVYSYEAVNIVLDAIEETGSTDPDEIKAYILAKGTYEGLQSPFTFNTYGDVSREYLIFQVEKGEFKRLY